MLRISGLRRWALSCCALWLVACSGAAVKTLPTPPGLTLSDHAFYVDPALPADEPARHRYRSLHDAVRDLPSGTAETPSVIWLAPAVYWLGGTETDRGLYIHQDWVSLIGLSDDAQDVVLADNRGHMIGAHGGASGSSPAETLFVTGTGFHAENLTLGNYCNVDLVYPRDPSQNRPKRSDTITQAYVIGAKNPDKVLDRYSFRNVRFISKLDTVALGYVQRVFYDHVYVQGTDDFIGGGQVKVFRDSIIHSFTNKPIWKAGDNGMAFINTRWEVEFADPGELMLTKNSSPLILINTAFEDLNGHLRGVRWAPYPLDNVTSYEYGSSLNGKPIRIEPEAAAQPLSTAQRALYTVQTLLAGDDGWDPLHEIDKPAPPQALLVAMDEGFDVRAGEAPQRLAGRVFPAGSGPLVWSADRAAVSLQPDGEGAVMVSSRNDSEAPVAVRITATAPDGISGHTVVQALPSLLPAPSFLRGPTLTSPSDGALRLDYALDLAYAGGERQDRSKISWYRMPDQTGEAPLLRAQNHVDTPDRSLRLSAGDVGHRLMARIEPAHGRSLPGPAREVIMAGLVRPQDLAAAHGYSTDFSDFPTAYQPALINGTWTVDTFYPKDQYVKWTAAPVSGWSFGRGIDGASAHEGLLSAAHGARLLYTRVGDFGDMSMQVQLDTEKTAGQGFGSANGQYLELYINYDTVTRTGYALRIERTAKYSFATDFTLMAYVHGVGRALTEPVSSAAFNPDCTIRLWTQGGVLHASATSATPLNAAQQQAGLSAEVTLKAPVDGSPFGGFGLQHTGTTGAGSRVLLRSLKVEDGAAGQPFKGPSR